jgi:hypothetical protein
VLSATRCCCANPATQKCVAWNRSCRLDGAFFARHGRSRIWAGTNGGHRKYKGDITGCYNIGPAVFTTVPPPCYTLSYGSATSRQSLRSLTLRILNMEPARLSTLLVSNPANDSFSI